MMQYSSVPTETYPHVRREARHAIVTTHNTHADEADASKMFCVVYSVVYVIF
jgi:hypothetical protein